jgi:hypothetical protein
VKHILSLCFLLVSVLTAFCQNGKLSGSVTDAETKTPLELATVTVFSQDSNIVAYSLSDKLGKFTIEKLPLRKSLLISVTYTGYAGYNKTIQLDVARTDTISVSLSLNNKDTNAVVVTATIPIRMNGDTLEINPGAFKLKQDAVVEEVLNQVSGITIWSDGTITVNGKQVQNLLVDGKPFMGSNDARVATQNLPKSAIEKIQLYQEYDRTTLGQAPKPQDSTLTMNIKLKEGSKKGYFGKAGAGYGTTDRFESDLSFQVYNKNSSLGVGGGYNNINKNIGNLQDMFQNNTYRNYNPNLYSVGRFGASGINKNHSFGGIYTHSFIETANSRQNNRIAINYNKSGTDAYVTDLSLQNRTTINNPQFIRDKGIQNNNGDRHDVGINYVRTNSYNDNLNLNGSVGINNDKGSSVRYTEVRDSANQLQSKNSTNTKQSRRSDNESLSVNFGKSNYEDPIKGFNVSMNARHGNSESQRDAKSTFQSFTDMTKNSSYNRRYVTNTQSVYVNGNLDYSGFKRLLLGRYNLFGINLNFTQRINYSRVSDNSIVGDYDSTSKKYITNSDLSNSNKRELFEYAPTLGLSKSLFKYNNVSVRNIYLQFRLADELKSDKNTSSFVKRNLDRSFQFMRYEGSFSYSYQKREVYQYFMSANYSRNFDYPLIDQLYTIVDDINVYNTRIGNPNLRNRVNHNTNVNLSFNTQKPKSVYSINTNVGGSYGLTLRPVTDSIINDISGKRTYYYINGDKNKNANLYYSFNISRKFNKNNLQLMYSGQFGNGKTPSYMDGVYNISETNNLSNNLNLQFMLRSLLVMNVGQTFQRYKSSQTASGLKSFKNNNNSTNLGLVLNYPKNFTMSSTIDRIDNSNLSKKTFLWNAFLTYRFMKQQGELKFSAMDLLKQYQNISNSVNSYGTTTRITNGLQQYFLLTFSYYPRKFGKTEIKKPTR